MSIAQYKQKDYIVETLGECKINSPLNLKASKSGRSAGFTPDDIRIYSEIESDRTTSCPTIEKAGPREKFISGLPIPRLPSLRVVVSARV